MKALKIFLAITFLCYFSSFSTYTQYSPNVAISTNIDGFVKYQIDEAEPQTHVFTLFGDGSFSTLQQPKHKFEASATGYTTEVYFAKAYDPNLPPKKIIQTGEITSGSSYVNPIVNMTGNIDILTSWGTASGFENFYIIAYTNTNTMGGKKVDGCIEFLYNTNEIDVNHQNIRIFDQQTFPSTVNNVSSSPNQIMKWNFTNLQLGEVRYIYIPAKTLGQVGQTINVDANLKVNCSLKTGSTSGNFLVKRYPHDPNFKIVNKNCLKPGIAGQQELIYTIGFYNDGNDFARNVYVYDVLSENLDENSISLVDYETQPTWSVNDRTLQLDFMNINLPGTNQSIPKIYSYDDASTYFSFKICTRPELAEPDHISNTAKIVFDTQPAFYTNESKIFTNFDCTNYEICGTLAAKNNLSKLDELTFNVYPNPASSHVEIDINFNAQETTNFTVRLLDYSGKIVEQLSVSDNYAIVFTEKFDLKQLSSGLYFMILETEHGRYTKKIIKN